MSHRESPENLLSTVLDQGAVAAEVYEKEGRSARMSLTSEGRATISYVEENGVAVRAWGESGGLGFVSFVPVDLITLRGVVERLGPSVDSTGDGAPDLPSAPPPVAPAPTLPAKMEDESLDSLGPALEEALISITQEFHKMGREAIRLEGAWGEAGTSDVHLINSSGFNGRQASCGWHLAIACRASRGGESRVGYLARSGRSSSELDPVGLVESVAWRAAAPLHGNAPPELSGPVLIDSVLASQILQSLSSFFTATERTMPLLERGERIGPDRLSIRQMHGAGSPSWDGEGVACRTVPLVEGGRITGLLTDLSSARRFGLPLTGSARRRSFRDRPEAGPTRLVLTWEGESDSDLALLERLTPGLYVTSGRIVTSDSGPGGAIVAGGIWVDGGTAVSAVRRAVVRGGPLSLLSNLKAVSSLNEAVPSEEAVSASILVAANLSPA